MAKDKLEHHVFDGEGEKVASFASPADARQFALDKFGRYGIDHSWGAEATLAEDEEPTPEEAAIARSGLDARKSELRSEIAADETDKLLSKEVTSDAKASAKASVEAAK